MRNAIFRHGFDAAASDPDADGLGIRGDCHASQAGGCASVAGWSVS